MINRTERLLLSCTLLGLLATNVLALTSIAFNAALSGFMSTALGVATVTDALQSKIAKQDKAINKRKAVHLCQRDQIAIYQLYSLPSRRLLCTSFLNTGNTPDFFA